MRAVPFALADDAVIGNRGRIGARVRTGQREARHFAAVGEPRQVILLLFLRAVMHRAARPGRANSARATVELTVEDMRRPSSAARPSAHSAEKPSPPYSFGMFMPKNLFFLRKSQISGGRSARSCVISQSSLMLHSSSHGPSRNACSSAESSGFGCASNCRPRPACRETARLRIRPCRLPAQCVRCRTAAAGSSDRIASSGALSLRRRNCGRFSGTATSAKESAKSRSPASMNSRASRPRPSRRRRLPSRGASRCADKPPRAKPRWPR